jgi:hypothetical protein
LEEILSIFLPQDYIDYAAGFHENIIYCPYVNVRRIFSTKLLPDVYVYEMLKREGFCRPGTRNWMLLLRVVTLTVSLPSYACTELAKQVGL